ncbi:M23 family metallopeptidase [Catelliglobosispora koreensis]|uniref:M23 family metallopeptidase n=1 Tax=Catelliglobosispora koreensis TaxID=129052 RepID=UPI0004774AB8|nr:M23 family metallopeptidase [Catelliglobosispora koreensis]
MRGGRLLLVVLALLNMAALQPDGDPSELKKRVDAELAKAGAIAETASAEAQQAVARLASLNQQVADARHAAAQARGAVAAAEVQAAAAARTAAQAGLVRDQATARYDEVALGVREGRSRLGRFVAMTYQGGDVAQFNALVSAGSPKDLMVKISYARKIAESKKDALTELIAAERAAKTISSEAALASRAAEEASRQAKAALAEAEAARAAAERSERELSEFVRRQEGAVADAQKYRDEVVARHEEVKRESDRIAAELLAWQQAQGSTGPVLQPGARLLMPVRGWKSSDYGQRYDPYYHVWQLHAGVDIAAGGGEPIYAAADGQIASAGWRGGYGNYTCVSHGSYQGRSLSTCYAHQSKILVGVGQWVTRGQLIGRVGTTGASTGNHLHFEVRLNGSPTDPEEWLPGCLC